MTKLTQDILDSVNKMLHIAVLHGGDDGGPYFCEAEDLENSAKDFIKSLDAEDELELYWWDYTLNDKGEYCKQEEQRTQGDRHSGAFIGIRFKEK